MSNDEIFASACAKGDKEAVLSMIKTVGSLYYGNGLCCACYGGHKEIAELMIKHGANDIHSLNLGLCCACQYGHRNLVELLICFGANNWNFGLDRASYGGHIDIVKLMLEKGGNEFYWPLLNASKNGHKEILLLLIETGADISHMYIPLADSDIYYLFQKGISYFGNHTEYNDISDHYGESRLNLSLILNTVLNRDLITEILYY